MKCPLNTKNHSQQDMDENHPRMRMREDARFWHSEGLNEDSACMHARAASRNNQSPHACRLPFAIAPSPLGSNSHSIAIDCMHQHHRHPDHGASDH